MLSKLFARSTACAMTKRTAAPFLIQCQTRAFRSDFLNPYLHNPIHLSEQERQS